MMKKAGLEDFVLKRATTYSSARVLFRDVMSVVLLCLLLDFC